MTHSPAGDNGEAAVTVTAGRQDPVVVTLSGKLDIESAPALREELLSLLDLGASQLVIDVSAVQYADASGLAVLVGSRRRAVVGGGTLRLAAPRPQVAGVLAATGIGRHLDVYPTLQAALVVPAQSRPSP